MGTGIVSIALRLDGLDILADVLLAIAAAAWVALALIGARRAVSDRARFAAGARSPAALTAVAGTCVLGSGAIELDWRTVAICLLILAFVAWGALMSVGPSLSRRRVDGSAFLLVVAPQALSTLCAELSSPRWLRVPAVALAALGIVIYPFVLVRFDLGTLRHGDGDQWVAGGSLAISALAVAELARLLGGFLRTLALVVWVPGILWLVVLVISELRWPRVRYRGQRWATVFPLGMYATCSFAVSSAARVGGIVDFARVWVWVAVAGWVLIAAGTFFASVVDFRSSRSSHRRPFPSKED